MPSLTTEADATVAHHIVAIEGLCFMGITPGTSGFVLDEGARDAVLEEDPASVEVIRPFLIGRDVNREPAQKPTRFIVDFGLMAKEDAETFKGAMRYVRQTRVHNAQGKPAREGLQELGQFWRAGANLRAAIQGHSDVIVIPCVSPRLLVSRQRNESCFDHQLMVIALSHWYFFGLLQSTVHEVWAWARGSTLKGDLRYTNTTIFETFPFPPQADASYDPRKVPRTDAAARLAEAAEAFDKARSRECRKRQLGLTKIHNLLDDGELPELSKAYVAMNDAVCTCYGWPRGAWRDEGEVLRRLLARNAELARL